MRKNSKGKTEEKRKKNKGHDRSKLKRRGKKVKRKMREARHSIKIRKGKLCEDHEGKRSYYI